MTRRQHCRLPIANSQVGRSIVSCLLPTTLCILLLLLAPGSWLLTPVLGQSATATLSGTVEDTNGAIIPGVRLTLANINTKASRQATANSEGSFVFPLLPPSSYTLTAEGQGFAPIRVENIILNVGDQKALQIQLKAGDVNAQVTIDSDVETVRTDGSVGTVINRQFVSNIPLNGRSLQALIQLTPGVVLTTANSSGNATGGGQFSVNGQRITSNYFMVDGVSANTGISNNQPGGSGAGQVPATTALGGTNSLVSLDALQEFRIESSSYAAEFGRTPGGQISLLTRSGTNQFHGSASYYFRNEALDANDWFANANRQPKPKERQNYFSGVVGGPIRRERLFFFASYEGLRLQQPRAAVVSVPTMALRAQAVPGLLSLLNALPVPNGQDFGNGTAQFAASYSDPGSFNVFALRVDAHLADTLTGFIRFNHAPSETQTRAAALSTMQSIRAKNDVYTGGLTWVTASRLAADVRINWTRNSILASNDPDAFGGAVIPAATDLFLSGRNPSNARAGFSAIGAGFGWGPTDTDVQRQFNVVGSVALSFSSHQLKIGADYRRLMPLFGGPAGNIESISFNSASAIAGGLVSSYQITNSDGVPREAIITNLSLFAQDRWQIGRRLTVTYGFRFERVPPPVESSGRLPRTVIGIDSDVLQNPRLAPEGTPLFHSRFGSFAPRFGAAYQLSSRGGWETTLRGGAGVFYDLGLGNIATAFQNIYPFFASKTVGSSPFPLSAAIRTPPVLGVDPPQQFTLLDPNLRLPYTIQWNTTWEQGLGQAQTITLNYVGAAGRRLLLAQQYFQRLAEWPSALTFITVQRSRGQSDYNGLQLQYQRRLRKGLQALASYTFGRSEDNASAQDLAAPPASRSTIIALENGPSDFDVRHVVSAAITYDLPKVSA